MAQSSTYSFLDVVAALVGPGGAVMLGAGAGDTEEGITIERDEDKDTITRGADGNIMHSLHAANTGRVTVRLLKTSPVNAQLSTLYNFQTTSSALHGQNTITINDNARGDNWTCTAMAFVRFPNTGYTKEGPPTMEWAFTGILAQSLGGGLLSGAVL
jgi:hypothetical protein